MQSTNAWKRPLAAPPERGGKGKNMFDSVCKIVVIDGQGGRMGSLLIERLKKSLPEAPACELYGIGTNSIATAAMLKAGADYGATGENPVAVNVRDADFVIGPLGILAADALLGEVTAPMAAAIGRCPGEKVLLPVNKCRNHVIGVSDLSMSALVQEAVDYVTGLIKNRP